MVTMQQTNGKKRAGKKKSPDSQLFKSTQGTLKTIMLSMVGSQSGVDRTVQVIDYIMEFSSYERIATCKSYLVDRKTSALL